MRGAYGLGLSCSYEPSLRLEHHLDPRRFQLRYLARLLVGLGGQPRHSGISFGPASAAGAMETGMAIVTACALAARQALPAGV